MIDVNVYLHRWPFRRLFGDDPVRLVSYLREKGVTQAWAGSFDGLLQRDISAVNARLAGDCDRYGPQFLIPFGSINPKLPDWEEDLRRCQDVHHMPGIRLHPNYHGYALADPEASALLDAAARRGLIVQIALGMEDERTQNPIMRVPLVNPAPLIDMLKRWPALRVVILNGNRLPQPKQLSAAGNVSFDIAMVEGVGGVARLANEVSPNRVLLGSLFPLFYFESSDLKVKEAGLPEDQERAIREGNARALLKK
jgi:predicted TIM-barrel fold metal-dependent hydrolase